MTDTIDAAPTDADIRLLIAHLSDDQKRVLREATSISTGDAVAVACRTDHRCGWPRGKAGRIYQKLVELGAMSKFCRGHYRLTPRGQAARDALHASA